MPQQPTDEWVEVPVTNDEWVEVPINDKPAAKEQPAPKQEKSAIPDYIANPIKAIQEKAEKGFEEQKRISTIENPFKDKNAVIGEFLADPVNKAYIEQTAEYIAKSTPEYHLFNPLSGYSETEKQLQQFNLYKKAAKDKLQKQYEATIPLKQAAGSDIAKLGMYVRNAQLQQHEIEKIPKNEKGEYLISNPEQQKLFDNYKSTVLDIEQLSNTPQVKASIAADKQLQDSYLLFNKAMQENKAPEIPALEKVKLAFKGGFVETLVGSAGYLKDLSLRHIIKNDEEAVADQQKIKELEAIVSGPDADKGWHAGKTNAQFAQSQIDILKRKHQDKMLPMVGEVGLPDFFYFVSSQLEGDAKRIVEAGQIDRKLGTKIAGVGDSDLWLHDIPQTVGSASSLMGAGLVGAFLFPEAEAVVATTWLGRVLQTGLQAAKVGAVATVINRPMEASAEAGSVYQEGMDYLLNLRDSQGNLLYTEKDANKIMQEHVDKVLVKNVMLAPLDVLQYGLALAPLGKGFQLLGAGKNMASAMSATTKFAIESTSEGLVEENLQGLWQWQERQKLEGKMPNDAKFWDGYDQWIKTDEAKMSIQQGIIAGGLLGGAGEVFSHLQERQQKAVEQAGLIDAVLKTYETGKENTPEGLKAQDALRNHLFVEAAISGNSDALINSMRTTREQTRVLLSDEENLKADEEMLAHIQQVQEFAKQAEGLNALDISTKSKRAIILLDQYGKQLEIVKENHISQLQEKGVNKAVIEQIANDYDSRIAENERNIKNVTKDGLEEFQRQAQLREEFALPLEEAKPEPVQVDLRDEKIKQDFRNRSNTPNVKDLLEDRPETFDDVVATVKRGEEVVPEKRAEVEEYIKEKEQLLAELKDNPERLFLSEDIQKAQDFIQKAKDILVVKEEKVAEPVVKKKPVEDKKADIERRRQEDLEEKVQILKDKRNALRGEDGVVPKENIAEWQQLGKDVIEAQNKATRGNNEGFIPIRTEKDGVLSGEDAINAENEIERVIQKVIKGEITIEQAVSFIHNKYRLLANENVFLLNYINDRTSNAPEIGNNKQSFPAWRKGKYDAELAALEGAKPTTPVSDIEAKKADIEKRRQEAKENPVPEPISYKEAVEEYKSTDLGGSTDAKRKKQRVVDEAQTKEGRAFVENQVAQMETNEDGTITVYRSGTMQEGHNPATTSKQTAEIIANERKQQGLSSDIIEVKVNPSDISVVVPGIESEIFIKVDNSNKERIDNNTKKKQKTKQQLLSEKDNVKNELEKTKNLLENAKEDKANGTFKFSDNVYKDIVKKQEQKIKNLEWQLTKYDAELAALEKPIEEDKPLPAREQKAAEKVTAANNEKIAEISEKAKEKIESLKLKAKKYDDAEAADLEELKRLAAERKKIADKKKNLGIVAQGPEEAGKEMAEEFDNYVKTAKIYLRMGARKGVRTVEEFAEKIGEAVNDVIKKAFAQAKTEYDDERGYNKEQAGHYQTEGERIAAEQQRDENGRVANERDEFGLSDVKASIKLYDLFRTLDANKENKGLFARTLQQGYAIIQKQDIPSDEKNFAYKEFKQMLMSAFEIPLTGNKQEDFDILEAQGFTVEDANFLTEEYDVLFFGDFTNGNEVNKVRHLYAPVNENGELVGLKDANGDIIPERKIYDMILDYSNSVKGFPENLTEFYSKMAEKSLANQLAKQKESDLVSLFNVFSSSKRKPFYYLSSFDGKLKMLPSNKERFDYSLVSALEEKVKKKYPAEVIKEKAAKFVQEKQALYDKNRPLQNKIGEIYAKFIFANKNNKLQEAERLKESSIPILKQMISNEAAFMEKVTGVSADLWIKGVSIKDLMYGTYVASKGKISGGVFKEAKGNVSTWVKFNIISAETFQEFINKLITKKGDKSYSQLNSLVNNIKNNPENTQLDRHFTGIDGKSQNADLFISYVDIALEDITSDEVQNNPLNKNNVYVKTFKGRVPKIEIYEGEKNNEDNEVATTNDIPTGDLLISMVEAFMVGMTKPTYMQFLEQQKDNASKVMVEAPTFKVDNETKALLEQNGLFENMKFQVEFVKQHIEGFLEFSNKAKLDLRGRSTLDIAKAFTWNWALNKKFMDDYLQPETDTKGNKNYKNYQDKTKRSIDNKGYHLNSRILTEKLGRPNMNMVVLDDPRAVIKIAPSFSDDMKELADGTYFVRDKAEDAIKDASGSLLGISKSFKFTYTDHNQDNTRTFLKGHGITLTKELAEFNPTYKALYEYMEKNDVDFLAFDSAVKKYDKAKQVKATWQNETHLAKEVPFAKNNVIELNPKYLLVQQDLRQESTFDDARVTRQQLYYAMRFKNYDKIQEIFNGIVKDKYDDFKAEFVSKSEKEQKEFLKGLLTSGSDKYDLYRSFLSNKKSSLHSIYFQPIMRNILSGYVKKRIMSLDVNKQISIEAPLLGGFRDEKGKLHNLKSVRIEDGKIKPGQVLVPTAYQTQGFKKGDVIFISRVPSTELHSITPLEIVGFLPESLGNIIMTDQGTRIGAGADYDGDMRHVWGKYKNDRGIDIMGNTYEAKINQVFDLMLEGYLGKALSGQELENQFTMITQPIDTGANKDMIKNHQERLAKDLSKDSIKSFLSQVESSQDGNRTIGIGARFNAIYALLEKHGASLRKEISFPGFTINKEGKPVENNKRISLSDFSHPDFEKQHSIRSVLANFLNHSTDNPTLGNLEPMGINRYTTSLAYMLDALGMEEQQIYDYLNHPIVRNYVALARKYSSPYYKLNKQEVFQFMVDKVKENESNYSPTDNWASKYKKLYTADIVATSGQGALKFIAMMDYMMGIADSLTDLSQLEALANDPVVDSNKFFTMKEKKKRLKENKVNYEPNKLRETVYLDNSTIALEWFNDFGKFYYPVMSNVGKQMYQEIRKASFIDPKVKGIIENRGLEDAMHQQFLINALNITESRAELAKKAKEVYDDMEETDPLKKLLKWDTKNNRLSVKEEYKHSLNESEKKEFRDEFEKLRGLASLANKEVIGTVVTGKRISIDDSFDTLLKHQVKEYGWNPSPRSGEYASFMDVGTHAIVSDMMKQEFDRWNNGGVDDTRMGMMDAMVKQMQLRNTNLIPQVHYQDGVLMSAKNLEIKQGTGYVKIGQGETAKIYNLEDLLDGKKDNFYTVPKGKYEMLPIEEFKNPIERIHTIQDAIDAQQKYAAPKTQGPKISLPTIKNKKEKYDIISARKDAVKETREGYKITVKEFPNTKFYLTKSGKNWFVDDATTGFSMGAERSTREEALFAFQQIVNNNSGNEYSLNKMKTTGLFVENTNPIAKKYQGKIIYASPASGKTGMVQQLKAQGIEDVIDFDNLLAIQYNKVMEERTGNPSFDVATGDTVGKLIWNPKANDGRGAGAIRDWGSTDVQISTQKAPVKVKNTTLNLYVPAIKEAQRLASEGKTVLMGSKAWIKNSIPLGNGQTFDFEVDYAFPSSKEADTRMMEQREMTEYDLNKFREGEQSQIKSLPTEKVQDLGTQKIGEVILNKTSDNNNLEDDTDETINKCNPKK